MQYNSHANNDDIVSDITFLLTGSATGSVDYSANDILRNVNRRYDETASVIMRANDGWQWDDNNHTDLPIATTNLVAGQPDYEVTGASFMNLMEVSIKDSNGDWKTLIPIDRRKTSQTILDKFENSDNGMPTHYDKIGNSIVLAPKPSASNVTLTAGLKVIYQRIPSYFVSGDTTKAPGFNPLYHRRLSIGAALDYCIANGLNEKRSTLENELQKLDNAMVESYSKRSNETQPKMTLQSEDYGAETLSGRIISEDSFNI